MKLVILKVFKRMKFFKWENKKLATLQPRNLVYDEAEKLCITCKFSQYSLFLGGLHRTHYTFGFAAKIQCIKQTWKTAPHHCGIRRIKTLDVERKRITRMFSKFL